MNLDYIRDIPLSSNNPSVDQPNMQINTNSINSWVSVDHYGFRDDEGGYHTVIHQDPSTAIGGTPTSRTVVGGGGYADVNFPPAIAGINQIFPVTVTTRTLAPLNTDTQLFAITGSGVISQLTGGASDVQGYQFIGRSVVMWGVVNSVLNTGSTGTISFQTRNAANTECIPFPNNVFAIYATPFYTNPGPPIPPSQGTPTYPCIISFNSDPATGLNRTQFVWSAYLVNPQISVRYQGFYWWAVGN